MLFRANTMNMYSNFQSKVDCPWDLSKTDPSTELFSKKSKMKKVVLVPADLLSLERDDHAAFLSVNVKEFFSADPEQPQTFHWGEDNYVIFITKITLVIPQACFDFHQEQRVTML